MHSGSGDTTACLSTECVYLSITPSPSGSFSFIRPPSATNLVSPHTAVGTGVGGLVLGLVVGLLGAFFLSRWAARRRARESEPHPMAIPLTFSKSDDAIDPFPTHAGYDSATGASGPSAGSLGTRAGGKVDTWAMQQNAVDTRALPALPAGALPPRRSSRPSVPEDSSVGPLPPGGVSRGPSTGSSHSTNNGGQVYVVHHDGGRAPVTVYTSDGTEVVELPPSYAGRSTPTLPPPPQQEQQPAPPARPVSLGRRAPEALPTKSLVLVTSPVSPAPSHSLGEGPLE
jgi:hypothetical protein